MACLQSSISNKNLQSSATAEQRGILTTINARNLSATSRFVHDRAIDHAAANRRRLARIQRDGYARGKEGKICGFVALIACERKTTMFAMRLFNHPDDWQRSILELDEGEMYSIHHNALKKIREDWCNWAAASHPNDPE
ncbi:predicted protein [Histoplasma capsulatum H143]|uniref:Uncharacterized protein n=1 Tax=Ajellomyces capsulatus (strain H143) TaxID=544712 RepID=C6HRG4_AJECH|nr:predicted protein [Histoplasma capsulatum H143]